MDLPCEDPISTLLTFSVVFDFLAPGLLRYFAAREKIHGLISGRSHI